MHITSQTIQTSANASKQTCNRFLSVKKNVLLFVSLLFYVISFGQKSTTHKKNEIYGVASFYNKALEGAVTATGEIFHHNQMIAASNQFKLNSLVRITNLTNGKYVIVRINDRMSKTMQALGRVADLTRLAAQQLDFISKGLTKVKVEEVIL